MIQQMVQIVWMSHGDRVENIPTGFEKNCNKVKTHHLQLLQITKNIYAFQFHPEVYHSAEGSKLLKILQNISVVVNQLGIWEVCKNK